MDPEQRAQGEAALAAFEVVDGMEIRSRRSDPLQIALAVLLVALAAWLANEAGEWWGVSLWILVAALSGFIFGVVQTDRRWRRASYSTLKYSRDQIAADLEEDRIKDPFADPPHCDG